MVDVVPDPNPAVAVRLDESIRTAESFDASAEFRDDLIAANRFKTFLVSSGVEVSERVIAGLAKLTSEYLYESSGLADDGIVAAPQAGQPWTPHDSSTSGY